MGKIPAKKRRILFIKQYLLFFIPGILVISAIILLLFSHDLMTEITLLKSEEVAAVKLKKSIIENQLGLVKSDVEIMAESNELRSYCESGEEEYLLGLMNELTSFLEKKKVYDHIRVFDNNGSELVKINYKDGSTLSLSQDKIRKRQELSYFTEIHDLKKGEIFVSPIHLNIDDEDVITQYQPVLRIAVPVFGKDNQKDCTLVLSFNAEHLFNLLGEKFFQYGKEIVLLNSDGYFLKSIYPDEEWGFMFKDKEHLTFGNKFPETWSGIKSSASGQVVNDYGIFSFQTLDPAVSLALPELKVRKANDLYHWKLISIIPHSVLKDLSSSLLERLILLNIFLVVIAAVVNIFVARLRVKNMLAAQQIENHLDELTRLNDKLVHSEKLLIEKNENKDKFISILSHDLKNPLGTLRNFSLLLKDDYDELEEEDKRSFIDSINHIAENTLNLLLTLLDWSRLNLGTMQYHPSKVNLKEIVERNFEMIKYQSQAKNISLEAEMDDSIRVTTDENMLNTLLRNFLSNAVKFTNNDGNIKVIAAKEDGDVKMCVSDDGVGMTSEQVEKLFEKNEKFSTKGTAQEIGTGLGLQLCRDLVKKLHGEISVQSAPGKGSSFCFNIETD